VKEGRKLLKEGMRLGADETDWCVMPLHHSMCRDSKTFFFFFRREVEKRYCMGI
jgi:hypothetical protein